MKTAIPLLLLLSSSAWAGPGAGNYRTPDGAIYYYNGEGHVCRWKDQGTFDRYSNHNSIADVPYDDLKMAIIDGYCEGIGSDPLPARIPSDREVKEGRTIPGFKAPPAPRLAGKYCRYFIATDKFTPLTHNADFGNLTLWIMDENRHSGLGDAWNWEDTHRVTRGLKTHEKQVHRSLKITSDWFELLPKDDLAPEFSFYGFHRWKSYLAPAFKVTNLNPLHFKDWSETKVVRSFTGTQDIAYHVAFTKSYALDYRALRLCAERLDILYPEPDLAIPARVAPPTPVKK